MFNKENKEILHEKKKQAEFFNYSDESSFFSEKFDIKDFQIFL